ncbi:HrpY/HrcU family type III secretion protein [Chlamydia abortus]|uniref:Flagellar biosynthetic protein FlhB n=1 Tax=Paenibacillus residui TaxID=629724 RepID=A0ABW3D6T9_9BACL|nr:MULTISPECIES: flagellar biosynthesis protein FlhB [Paenibacillaceae]SHE12136.1 HrpY/HrcU family type III secretion protein [Chlamydia abortus]
MTAYRWRMDLQLFSQEKTEPATPKKKREARQKGQVAKSMELPGALVLFFTFVAFLLFGGFLKERLFEIFTLTLYDYMLMNVTIPNTTALFNKLMIDGMIMLSPILLFAIVMAVIGNYVQIGVLFTGEPLKMKLNKLNPVEGAKKMFGLRSLVEFLKTVFKLIVIGVIVFFTLWGKKESLMGLAHLPLESILSYVAQVMVELGVKIGLVLIVLAIFDYMYQKYEHEKGLRMSKQDIKDEYKKTEGDPLIKSKIKERQRRMAMQRMMQEVPKADVIITNPTHFAVALKYESGKMEAPKVIAKGVDLVALKIREIGKQNGIAIMENKPLARALYERVELNETIPGDLFQAVAEVLAYVYKLKGKVN